MDAAAGAGNMQTDAMVDAPADGGAEAGAPTVDTVVATPVKAGDTLSVTCPVTGTTEPTLIAVDTGAGVLKTNGPITVTKAGPITVTCTVPSLGLVDATPAMVTVQPGLPANLTLSRSPYALFYPAGTDVKLTAVALDAWGNTCTDAVLMHAVTTLSGGGVASEPQADTFHLPVDGTYRVTYTVEPPTAGGVALSLSVDLVVDDGPSITCDSPADFAAVNSAGMVVFSGSVSDANALDSQVTINGVPAAVTNGQFQASVGGTFGMNFVDVVATNSLGLTARRTCTFLQSSHWLSPETAAYADGLSFALAQGAVDDGTRTGSVNSLGDLVYAVANSAGLKTTLDSALKAANPLKPESCDNQVCIPAVGCACVDDSGVKYLGVAIDGPNPTTVTLVAGGLAVHTRVSGVHTQLEVFGNVGGVPYDTTGFVGFSFVDVDYVADVALVAGKPHVSLRQGTTVTTPGTITPNFSGLDGWILSNVVTPLAQGMLATDVKNTLQAYLTTNEIALLDATLSSISSGTLGASRAVPTLDGGAAKTLSFALTESSVTVAPSALLIGAATGLSSTATQARLPGQVALPNSPALSPPTIGAPATAGQGTHLGVLEQFLHALWRTGYFQVSLTLASGAKVDVDAMLPPIVSTNPTGATPTGMKLAFGGLALTVNDPGLPSNLKARVGGAVTLAVTLAAPGLAASAPAVTELHVDVDGASLTSAQSTLLSQRATELLATIAPATFNNAFGVLPLLDFPLPSAAANFGLPAAQPLILKSPSLSLVPDRFVEVGGFGL
jgi:hypothetical protein